MHSRSAFSKDSPKFVLTNKNGCGYIKKIQMTLFCGEVYHVKIGS